MTAPRHGVVLGLLAACSFNSPTAGPNADAPRADDAPAIDAAVDAMPDATPFVCNPPGAQCPGGMPLVRLTCGAATECWIGCVGGPAQTQTQMAAFCASLGMTMGVIDNAIDDACVRTGGISGGAILLGITQPLDQGTTDGGWVRVSDNTPVQVFRWAGGQPNDGDGDEDNAEQCAYASNPSGLWQDTPCDVLYSRWICRHP